MLYILHLIIGFEFNVQIYNSHKVDRYNSLLSDLSPLVCGKVISMNLSMAGFMDPSCASLLSLLHELSFDQVIRKNPCESFEHLIYSKLLHHLLEKLALV